MKITTERAGELANELFYANFHEGVEIVRALVKERDELKRVVDSYQFALAETEALEIQHGSVIKRLTEQLAAAQAREAKLLEDLYYITKRSVLLTRHSKAQPPTTPPCAKCRW